MRNKLIIILTLFTTKLFAQVPEDAIKFSWNTHSGSARYMAIGGVMGSLGGDISAAFVNPAGLGLFKTREYVFTPGIIKNNNKATFRETENNNKKNAFNLGPSGIIIGFSNVQKPETHNAFCIAINQTANFNNIVKYSGLNNYSSFSEQFAEEFAKSKLSIETVLNSNSPLPYTAAPALYTYLMDTVRVNGVLQVKTAPEYLLDSGKSLMQEMNKTTSGGVYELAFAFASNIKEKWLYGFTVGMPIINYQSNTSFTEKDISGDTTNGFSSFNYVDNYKTTGTGFNLKLGVIYRPKEYIRLGFAFHTPNFMALKDTRTTTLTSNLENPVSNYSTSSTMFTNNQPGESRYSLNTPWKAIISASYVFREIENVRKQKGFISADIEYLRHRGSRFSSGNETPTIAEKAYYKSLNEVVKTNYKGTINFRVGGELKFDIIMARIGFAYYSNPYKDDAFKANKMLLSGGLGYRNNGFFVDLTYVYNLKKDVDLPYRLEDRANTFAELKQKQGHIVATIGVKF